MKSPKGSKSLNLIATMVIALVAIAYFVWGQKNESFSKRDDVTPRSQTSKDPSMASQGGLKNENSNGIQLNNQASTATARPLPVPAQGGSASLPPDLAAQLYAPAQELPEDLKQQLLTPPPELPPDLKAQLNAPPPELPDDIKKAMATPPRVVTLEEVNTPPGEMPNAK